MITSWDEVVSTTKLFWARRLFVLSGPARDCCARRQRYDEGSYCAAPLERQFL